jgi:hypothetical protein
MSSEDDVILIPLLRWPNERGDSGYEETNSGRAIWMLENLDRRRAVELRNFAAQARLGNVDYCRLDDREVRLLIGNAIRDGRLLAIRKGTAGSRSSNATADLRRLLAQIEKQTRRKLSFRGRQYKLVVGDDLAKTPARDSYEVVGQTEARAIFVGIAQQSGASAELLSKAGEKISKDWRPPFSQPEGLVLLRWIPVQDAAPKQDTPVITPSQMASLVTAEESVTLEVVVLGLDDKPLKGISYVVDAPDEETYEGQLGASGKIKITSTKQGSASIALKWADSEAA